MNEPDVLIRMIYQQLGISTTDTLSPANFEIIDLPDQSNIIHLFQTVTPSLIFITDHETNIRKIIEVVTYIRRQDSVIPIVLLSQNHATPFTLVALKGSINNNQRRIETPSGISSLKQPDAGILIGNSESLMEIKNYLRRVAQTDSTVLITGETGTGKELAAEMIHQNSARSNQPFAIINCTALPESLVESELFGYEKGAFTGAGAAKKGKFEQANSGTVFLDEIGDMSLFSQAKILRTIERKEIYRLGGKGPIRLDFRIVAATNKTPEDLVSQGSFRNDLFYRLNIAHVNIPPLRERKDDIPLLITHFINKMNGRFGRMIKGFTKEAEHLMARYNWPGNVRELKNIVEASFLNLPMDKLSLMKLSGQLKNQLSISPPSSVDERKKVVSVLLETKWNKSKAAQKLNWSRMTIYRKMANYNIVEKRSPNR